MLRLTMWVHSDDTLIVRSLRIIDACSSSKSALIVIDIGRVTTGDSLMLFDITLGYNAEEFRPGTILRENTLGAQLNFDNGPFINLQVPGEIRLSGFHVTRPANGNQPLIAFNGEVLRTDCGRHALLTMPYSPEFNEEFKKSYSTIVLEPVEVHTNPKMDTTIGVELARDTIRFLYDETDTVAFTLSKPTGVSGEATFELADFAESVRIDEVLTDHEGAEVQTMTHKKMTLKLASFVDILSGHIVLSKRTNNSLNSYLTARMRLDSCACVTPGKVSQSWIQYEPRPTTTKNLDAAEGSETYYTDNEYLYGQNVQEHPVNIRVFDVMGNECWSTTCHLPCKLSRQDMSLGLYYVTITGSRSRRVIQFVRK